MIDLGMTIKELYPLKNERERFEFLANVFRRRNMAKLRGYAIQTRLLSTRYPYLTKVLETFEPVFNNKYPFLMKGKDVKD